MNARSKLLLRGAVLAGVAAGLTACLVVNVTVKPSQHARAQATPQPPPGTNEVVKPASPIRVVPPPTGNAGALYVPIGDFTAGDGGQACFPYANGWDSYYPLPKLFLGPGVEPDADSYTNIGQLKKVTVKTCNPTNGATLKTGVVIYEKYHALTDKKCATNAPSCPYGTNLTINQRNIASNKTYIAVVYYKSKTLGTNTSVVVDWSYP